MVLPVWLHGASIGVAPEVFNIPKFSPASNGNLKTCHEDLQTLFRIVVEDYDCSVIAGYRDKKTQDYVFNAKLSKVQWPDSKHNHSPLSFAADVVPYPVDWENRDRFYHFAGFVKGIAQQLFDQGKMKHRIRWGGDWDGDTDLHDQTFMDYPHFELVVSDD